MRLARSCDLNIMIVTATALLDVLTRVLVNKLSGLKLHLSKKIFKTSCIFFKIGGGDEYVIFSSRLVIIGARYCFILSAVAIAFLNVLGQWIDNFLGQTIPSTDA